ncbi:HAD domain-containing protein [Paraburkholderia sp. 32]|uniref:HAD domain-containing protein n=1 Tax=Paraburkholderia sp. 32 TaxID=2991057 RepID=UPI003D25292E
MSNLEDGRSIGTEALFKVLYGLGLEMLVVNRNDTTDALQAVRHPVDWSKVMARRSPRRKSAPPAPLRMDNTTPTLFDDFDGTLHVGNAYVDENDEVAVDTGRPLLEFAPLLVDVLAPYPAVEIVLTTSWARRLSEERVIAYLLSELRPRVVGTTRDIKPRRSYVLDGTERTDVICSYVYGKRLKHWLAVDDAVFGAERFGREPGELVERFLLLDSSKGISDGAALSRIAQWLAAVHGETKGPKEP